MAQHRQADDVVGRAALGQLDAAHARRIAPGEDAQLVVGGLEADAAAQPGGQQHVVALAQGGHADQLVALVELHGDQAGGTDVAEVRQAVAPDIARPCGEDQMQAVPQRFVLRQRQHGGDGVLAQIGQQVDQRLALPRGPALWQFPDFFPVGFAAGGEEQHPLMSVAVEAAGDDVVAARAGGRASAAAAVLLAEGLQRGALDVAVAGDGHHHLAGLDQAFVVLVGVGVGDGGHPGGGDFGAHAGQFGLHDVHALWPAGDDGEQVGDLGRDLAHFLVDLLTFQPGQAREP